MLGRQSARPSLRLAGSEGDVEATEVPTPFEGFLGGCLLAGLDGEVIARAPDTVFVAHRPDDGGESDLLVSRVDAGGLAWSARLRQLAPDLRAADHLDVMLAIDRGDALVLWARSTQYGPTGQGTDLVLALGVADGVVRWQTVF